MAIAVYMLVLGLCTLAAAVLVLYPEGGSGFETIAVHTLDCVCEVEG